jgi:hypothetical protein
MVRVVEEARAARAAGEVRTCLRLCARAFRAVRLTLVFCSLPCPRHAYSILITPFDPLLKIYLASYRVVRPSTAGRTRLAIIPRARHARFLRAPSAPRRTQRRACAFQLDCLYLCLYYPRYRRRINPADIRSNKEWPTLPAYVARALRDA